MPIRICITIAFLGAIAAAHAQPARFDVIAGLVRTDEGAFRVVVLTPDSVGDNPVPKYCGPGWSHGLIQGQYRSPQNNGAALTTPGCWSSTSSNPEHAQFTFRYIDPARTGVREFNFDGKQLNRFQYEWRTERLFPALR